MNVCCLDRIGMEIDLQNGSDLEHGFDRHRIQVGRERLRVRGSSLLVEFVRHRSILSRAGDAVELFVRVSSKSAASARFVSTHSVSSVNVERCLVLEDPHYSSSNMDDLIDSMARRHLASRRGDARFSPQRGNGYYGSYSGMNERADRASLPNEYLLYSNRMGHGSWLASMSLRFQFTQLRFSWNESTRVQPAISHER